MHFIWISIKNKWNHYISSKKTTLFYVFCIIFPLIITDSAIFTIIFQSEHKQHLNEMKNIADAVSADVIYTVSEAVELTNFYYINRSVNEFLEKNYTSTLDYYEAHQDLSKQAFLTATISNNVRMVMFSDNETLVNGGNFQRISSIKDESWYQEFQSSDGALLLHFYYIGDSFPAVSAKKRVSLIRRLDYYKDLPIEKLVRADINYNIFVRRLENMNYSVPVYVCLGNMILFSNDGHSDSSMDFDYLDGQENIGYEQSLKIYGEELRILVMQPKGIISHRILTYFPLVLLMLLINIFLPLASSYAIQRAVYMEQMERQKSDIAKKNAELHALHSQINPHFLFNVLESIRMHCVIKKEDETAGMIERLALLERQNADWTSDLVRIEEEIHFIEAYLQLQQYRFGERLSYQIEMAPECADFVLPKLTLVTFVENACVHGVEKKTTPCWIYIRVYQRDELLCLEIEDTGAGMSETDTASLLQKMQDSNIDTLQNSRHIGIVNACLRLKMLTEEQTDFILESESGVGTFLLIKVPLRCLETKDSKKHSC